MALILLSGVALLDLVAMGDIAIVVSLLAITNTALAIRGATHLIALRPFCCIFIGIIPTAVLGVWLLQLLGGDRVAILKLLLGATLIISCLLLAFKPSVQQQTSRGVIFWLAGSAAGIIGGLFGAFGPPLIFVMYRQPMDLARIRITLQTIFLVTALYRMSLVTVQGQLSVDALTLTAIAFPVVVVVTLLSRKHRLPLQNKSQLRLTYILLTMMGCALVLDSYLVLSS